MDKVMDFVVALIISVLLVLLSLYGGSLLLRNQKFLRALKNLVKEEFKFELLIPLCSLILFLLFAFFLCYCIAILIIGRTSSQDLAISSRFIEGSIITLSTFFVLLFVKAVYEIRSFIDSKHWKEYESVLKSAKCEIKAISTASINKWFHPISFRYLVKQLEYLKLENQHRILIVYDKKVEFSNSWAHESFNLDMCSLTEEQRKFRNLVELQHNAGIKLYFVTSARIRQFLKDKQKENQCKKVLKIKDIDRLIIDGSFYHPYSKKKELCFDKEENSEIQKAVNELCNVFMVSDYCYEKSRS